MSLIETEDLSCHFGGIKAIDAVSFSLDSGEIRALIGPNGAGKSTFVNLLSGRAQPTAGRIRFDGRDITTLRADQRTRLGMAYTFQITSVFANLTCHDNVELAAQRALTGTAANHSRVRQLWCATREALSQVGLEARADQLAGSLAYGHQRLLEIAMGLALRPRLLLLDEPTQGLADAEIENFIELVRQVARQATVLLIEHNMAVVMALAGRITVLDNGRILAEGNPAEIQLNQAVQRAYLGT